EGAGYTYASYLLADITPGTGASGSGTVSVWRDANAPEATQHRPFGLDTRDQSFYVDGQGNAFILAAVNTNADIAIISLNSAWSAPTAYVLVLRGEHRETPSVRWIDGRYYLFSSKASGWYPSQT